MAVTVSGVVKGVGMIHPNMATMLCLVLTDATAAPEVLEAILRPVVARTWDQLSVDGDQSTNDTVLLVASGRRRCGSDSWRVRERAGVVARRGGRGPIAGAPAGR